MARMTRTDSSIVRNGQSYTLTRTWKYGDDVLRAVVHVDTYRMQSWAAGSILAADRTWTPLATADRPDASAFNFVSPYARDTSDTALWASGAGDLVETLRGRLKSILG